MTDLQPDTDQQHESAVVTRELPPKEIVQPPGHLVAVGAPLAVVAVALLAVNLRLVFGSSSALATEIRDGYHLGPASAALLTTGPVVCLGLFGLAAPKALRRWSAPLLLASCLLLIAAGTAVRGVNSWPVLLLGTLVAGAGIAMANVLGPVFVRMFFPHRIGLMTGLFTALVSASAGIASGVTVPLSTGVLHSWRVTLLAWAAPTVLAFAVFVTLTLRHQRAAETKRRSTSPSMSDQAPSILRSRTAWAVTGFMGVQSLLAYSMIAWLPTIYRDRGLSAETSGLVLTALSVTSIITALAAPIMATRLRDQRGLALCVVALSVAGLVGVLAGGSGSALIWATLLGLGQGGQLALALSMVNLRSRDAADAANLSTMVQSIGYLIAAIGPIVVGAVHGATGGWTAPLALLLALMLLLAAFGWVGGANRVIGGPTTTGSTTGTQTEVG